ncbi:MAG: ABC transporter ATP-binding protein [Burkholderiales bacterium]|nr:ABC transporter ATP-binding protein [Burkholderiales bacterium]
MALLDVTGLTAHYGTSQVLFGMAFSADAGSCITLVGRNGMGKSTTVKSLLGILPSHCGEIRFNGESIGAWPSHRIAQAGIGLVPEMRQVFPTLTVRENLVATGRARGEGGWHLQRVYGLFPRLAERERHLGSQLSGGEQQMLAIGRALMTNPRLLVLDEATEGLAPLVRAEIWRCLATLKREGLTLLVIDKNIGPLARLADHHYIVEKGRIAWHGDSQALHADPKLLRELVGV